MQQIDIQKLKADLHYAFKTAIEMVGMESFKKTSFFASNEVKARKK